MLGDAVDTCATAAIAKEYADPDPGQPQTAAPGAADQVRPGAGKQVLDSAGQQLLLPVLVSIKCTNQMAQSGVWCLDTALTIAVPSAGIHI